MLQWGSIIFAMAADGAARGAAAARLNEASAALLDLADDSAASGAAAGSNEALAEPAAATGAAAGLNEAPEAPEITGDIAAPPAAPRTPPLRVHGPFTDAEWERRQSRKRRAEGDIAHALEPIRKWMLEQVLQRHQQADTIEFLRRRLETTTAAMESMERQFDRLRPPRRDED